MRPIEITVTLAADLPPPDHPRAALHQFAPSTCFFAAARVTRVLGELRLSDVLGAYGIR